MNRQFRCDCGNKDVVYCLASIKCYTCNSVYFFMRTDKGIRKMKDKFKDEFRSYSENAPCYEELERCNDCPVDYPTKSCPAYVV